MKNKRSIKEQLKTLSTENWAIWAVEVIIAAVFCTADSIFWKDIIKGISFLGEAKKGYEYAVAIVVLILALVMLFLAVYDLFFRDYVKERAAIPEKEVRHGKVVVLSKEKHEETPEEKKD